MAGGKSGLGHADKIDCAPYPFHPEAQPQEAADDVPAPDRPGAEDLALPIEQANRSDAASARLDGAKLESLTLERLGRPAEDPNRRADAHDLGLLLDRLTQDQAPTATAPQPPGRCRPNPMARSQDHPDRGQARTDRLPSHARA